VHQLFSERVRYNCYDGNRKASDGGHFRTLIYYECLIQGRIYVVCHINEKMINWEERLGSFSL